MAKKDQAVAAPRLATADDAETARRAGDQGAEFLRLSVGRKNRAARRFYSKMGLQHAAGECIYTQDIFYQRADVLTASIHADPLRFYPFFWGHASVRGEGPGLGYNLNLPLPRGTGDDGYLKTLQWSLVRTDAFAPQGELSWRAAQVMA